MAASKEPLALDAFAEGISFGLSRLHKPRAETSVEDALVRTFEAVWPVHPSDLQISMTRQIHINRIHNGRGFFESRVRRIFSSSLADRPTPPGSIHPDDDPTDKAHFGPIKPDGMVVVDINGQLHSSAVIELKQAGGEKHTHPLFIAQYIAGLSQVLVYLGQLWETCGTSMGLLWIDAVYWRITITETIPSNDISLDPSVHAQKVDLPPLVFHVEVAEQSLLRYQIIKPSQLISASSTPEPANIFPQLGSQETGEDLAASVGEASAIGRLHTFFCNTIELCKRHLTDPPLGCSGGPQIDDKLLPSLTRASLPMTNDHIHELLTRVGSYKSLRSSRKAKSGTRSSGSRQSSKTPGSSRGSQRQSGKISILQASAVSETDQEGKHAKTRTVEQSAARLARSQRRSTQPRSDGGKPAGNAQQVSAVKGKGKGKASHPSNASDGSLVQGNRDQDRDNDDGAGESGAGGAAPGPSGQSGGSAGHNDGKNGGADSGRARRNTGGDDAARDSDSSSSAGHPGAQQTGQAGAQRSHMHSEDAANQQQRRGTNRARTLATSDDASSWLWIPSWTVKSQSTETSEDRMAIPRNDSSGAAPSVTGREPSALTTDALALHNFMDYIAVALFGRCDESDDSSLRAASSEDSNSPKVVAANIALLEKCGYTIRFSPSSEMDRLLAKCVATTES